MLSHTVVLIFKNFIGGVGKQVLIHAWMHTIAKFIQSCNTCDCNDLRMYKWFQSGIKSLTSLFSVVPLASYSLCPFVANNLRNGLILRLSFLQVIEQGQSRGTSPYDAQPLFRCSLHDYTLWLFCQQWSCLEYTKLMCVIGYYTANTDKELVLRTLAVWKTTLHSSTDAWSLIEWNTPFL